MRLEHLVRLQPPLVDEEIALNRAGGQDILYKLGLLSYDASEITIAEVNKGKVNNCDEPGQARIV